MSITARRSDSFAESRPNCISWIVRVGALEYAKLRFAIFAAVTEVEVITESRRRSNHNDAES